MSKIEFVCTKCGFRAFVENLGVLELSGWLVETGGRGGIMLCCPACRSENACDTPRERASAAGRQS